MAGSGPGGPFGVDVVAGGIQFLVRGSVSPSDRLDRQSGFFRTSISVIFGLYLINAISTRLVTGSRMSSARASNCVSLQAMLSWRCSTIRRNSLCAMASGATVCSRSARHSDCTITMCHSPFRCPSFPSSLSTALLPLAPFLSNGTSLSRVSGASIPLYCPHCMKCSYGSCPRPQWHLMYSSGRSIPLCLYHFMIVSRTGTCPVIACSRLVCSLLGSVSGLSTLG